MRGTLITAVAALLSVLIPGPAQAQVDRCAERLMPIAQQSAPHRLPVARDIIELRDIGPTGDVLLAGTPMAVSPDGQHLAFELHRADVASNSYCVGLAVLDLSGSRSVRLVEEGGEFVPWTTSFRGIVGHPLGLFAMLTPRWSPDGKWIAFLRRDAGVNEVWIVGADGRNLEQLTHSSVDVDGFGWLGNGTIVYSSRPGIPEAQAALDRQARTGYPFGPAFEPMVSSRPFITGSFASVSRIIDLATRQIRLATAEEEARSGDALNSAEAAFSSPIALGPGKRRAWTEPKIAEHPFGAKELRVSIGGKSITCADPACDKVVNLWWLRDGRKLVYLKREGWGDSAYAIYAWRPGPRRPKRLLVTDNWLGGCVLSDPRLICLAEGSLEPRHVVSIAIDTGRIVTLYDPNPSFHGLELGSARRLYWKNAAGFQSFGDLVIPSSFKAGQKLPLIIVQYQSKGFLRGGTGDEYPVQLFAAAGYAVLNVNRPPLVGMDIARNDEELGRIGLTGWADRRSVQSSLDTGIDLVEHLGIVDPERIGITGLSDGGTTVDYALVNSHRFAVAETSSCCMNDSSFMAYLNPEAASHFLQEGYPSPNEDGRGFWRGISLRLNAAAINVPILMQLSDDEYLDAVQPYTALRLLNKPVEMIVYPNEHHIKWQPSHRQAIYCRSLRWFDYWFGKKELGQAAATGYYSKPMDLGASCPALSPSLSVNQR